MSCLGMFWEAFFFALPRAFGDMLRDGPLLLEQGRMARDWTPHSLPQDNVFVGCRTPSGAAGGLLWRQEACA